MLGEALKRLRLELGYSQEKLAKELRLSFATINRWENGRVEPNSRIAMSVLRWAKTKPLSPSCLKHLEEGLLPKLPQADNSKLHRLDINMAGMVVDDSSTGIYVADANTYELLYLNQAMENLIAGTNAYAHKNTTCYGYLLGKDKPCDHCHLKELNDKTYKEHEYISALGNHYVSRGRLVTWEGKKAHIEYVTDESKSLNLQREAAEKLKRQAEELQLTKEKLLESRTYIDKAGAFSKVWYFSYNILTKICYPGTDLQESFGFPQQLANFPESVFDFDYVLPEYKSVYCNAFLSLCKNHPVLDFEVQTRYPDNSVHWVRFRGQLIKQEDTYGDIAAICAQEVDTIKNLEAQLQQERKNLADENKKLVFYAISNVTTNKTLEYKGFLKKELAYTGFTMEEQALASAAYIPNIKEKRAFIKAHTQQALLSMYAKGISQKDFTGQVKLPSRGLTWCKLSFHLFTDPLNGDVLLYEYLYDANSDMLTSQFVKMVLGTSMINCGTLNVRQQLYTSFSYNKLKDCVECYTFDYYKGLREYAEKNIVPEDREAYIKHYTIEQLIKNTKQRDDFYFRVIQEGQVRYKRNYAYANEDDENMLFLTRSDVTELVLGIRKGTEQLLGVKKSKE